MTSPAHTAVWLDHQEARVFHVDRESFDEKVVASPHRHVRRHEKGATQPHAHPEDQARFFEEVTRALAGAEEILVVGPSTAKLQLVRWLNDHDRAVAAKIVGIETVDHPSDPQLVAYVKGYFLVPDARVH